MTTAPRRRKWIRRHAESRTGRSECQCSRGWKDWVDGLRSHTGSLHVAVRDGGEAVPQHAPQAPEMRQAAGRGLFMVDALSTRWGWEPLDTAKRVWFELPCAPISHSWPGQTSA
jgi:hypothetical protein